MLDNVSIQGDSQVVLKKSGATTGDCFTLWNEGLGNPILGELSEPCTSNHSLPFSVTVVVAVN